MTGLASASTPASTFPSIQQSTIQSRRSINPCNSVVIPTTIQSRSSHLSLTSSSFVRPRVFQRSVIICRSSTGPGDAPGSGDNESRNVLDAFFLGKALAEALHERIESTIGELLSSVGRLQAEQQKQVVEFQEEVLERAKRAKEEAAREAMEAQGLIIPESTAVSATSVTNGATSKASPSTTIDGISANPPSYSPAAALAANTEPDPAKQE